REPGLIERRADARVRRTRQACEPELDPIGPRRVSRGLREPPYTRIARLEHGLDEPSVDAAVRVVLLCLDQHAPELSLRVETQHVRGARAADPERDPLERRETALP